MVSRLKKQKKNPLESEIVLKNLQFEFRLTKQLLFKIPKSFISIIVSLIYND
jgi:hypothetical protein